MHAAEIDRISSYGLFHNDGAMGRKQKKSTVSAGLCVEECHAKVISSFDNGIIKNYSIAQISGRARSRRPDQCCTVRDCTDPATSQLSASAPAGPQFAAGSVTVWAGRRGVLL